jgi:hypothetical protein
MGDGYDVQAEMYDDGRLVCAGGRQKRTESNDWYPIHCDAGYELAISPNLAVVS